MGDNGRNSSDRKKKRQQRCNNILVVLRCLICFAFGVNVYLSILHDTDTGNNNNSMKQKFNSKNKRNSKSTTKSGISLSQPPATTTTTTRSERTIQKEKIQKKIQLLLSDSEIEWIQTRSQIFNTSIDFHKLRQFYIKAQHDPLSRSGHPDHKYAIDSASAASATARTNLLLQGSSDDSVNNSNSSSSNNNNFNNNNEVIINKVNGNPGISLGDGPWLDFMIAGK
jgi:hypothetical protein